LPELPDVEVFRRYVASTALHQKVVRVTLRRERDLVRGVSASRLRKGLRGTRLISTRRHGKYAFAELDGGGWLVMHFGMSGSVAYYKHHRDEPEYARLVLEFEGGYRLAYLSQRLLGRLSLTDDVDEFLERDGLGPDALSLGLEALRRILADRRGMIKPTLTNQRVVAGIGNIYSDEILFQAGVHPRARSCQLGKRRTARLHASMLTVLRTAIRHRANPGDLPRSYLIPRRAEGEDCPRCGATVKRIRISGRTAYYCPRCQRK
jgi:formamidopyrimidine-DNA glycosylase